MRNRIKCRPQSNKINHIILIIIYNMKSCKVNVSIKMIMSQSISKYLTEFRQHSQFLPESILLVKPKKFGVFICNYAYSYNCVNLVWCYECYYKHWEKVRDSVLVVFLLYMTQGPMQLTGETGCRHPTNSYC